jgi:hypothetical protein
MENDDALIDSSTSAGRSPSACRRKTRRLEPGGFVGEAPTFAR